MSYIRGEDRGQAALLPAAIEDYAAADAPVRVIDAFVDGLNVGEVGFGRSTPAATGRPPYDPRDLLKLYIWGYFNEIRSSRRLERE
jgi:transposase